LSRSSSAHHLREAGAELGGRQCFAPQEPDTRDNLAVRSKRVQERYPAALNLERDILDSARPELAGLGSVLCGTHDPDKFREMLRGKLQSLPLYDLARLALSERPEAGAFVDRVLEVLAAKRGKVLTPIVEAPVSLSKTAGAVGAAAGQISAAVCSSLADGQVNEDEASRIDAEVAEAEKAIAEWKASRAKGGAK
jgi:hypothetical protein